MQEQKKSRNKKEKKGEELDSSLCFIFKKKTYSGAHSRVATLIQPSFQKTYQFLAVKISCVIILCVRQAHSSYKFFSTSHFYLCSFYA